MEGFPKLIFLHFFVVWERQHRSGAEEQCQEKEKYWNEKK
jgi:hypothetical protein